MKQKLKIESIKMCQRAPRMTSDLIDSERVYRTKAMIKRVGGAVAVCLADAALPGTARNKHMTILYRGDGRKWTKNEIEIIRKETQNWMKQKYERNPVRVPFTINFWGRNSVKIGGDLNDLCIHLRSKFAAMTSDKQRIPHSVLFKNGGHRNKARKNRKHSNRDCPQKRQHKKGGNMKKKLERMIGKMQELKDQKQRECELLEDQKSALKELANNADKLNDKELRQKIKEIAKSFKMRKNIKKRKNKKLKDCKEERKRKRKRIKNQKKLQREERRKAKEEKLEKLRCARIESLPSNKSEIGDSSTLYIYVDGYNVIGCDSSCRRNMRGRGGGIKRSRLRLTRLIQENFINKYGELGLNYNIAVKLWFDGNGKNEKYKDIEISFSTKRQIVDDKLVELFSKNDKKTNSNILVITSDKELTFRLYEIGVKVMKSGCFYKTFLKEKEKENDHDEDEEKKLEIEDFGETQVLKENDDDFEKHILSKIEEQWTTGTSSGESDESDHDDQDALDEVEGNDDFSEDQVEGNNDDEVQSLFDEVLNDDHSDYIIFH